MENKSLLESYVGATAATLLETAGSVAAAIAGFRPAREWLSGCKTRILAGRWVPGSHDLLKGVRTAHLCALDHVARRYTDLIANLPAHEVSEDDFAFARELQAFIDRRLKPFSDRTIDHGVPTDEDITNVLEQVVHAATSESFVELSRKARTDCESRALNELTRHIGRKAPNLFERVFRGDLAGAGGASWYDAFSLYVTEELKTNERFRSIFFATELLDNRQAIAAINELVRDKIRVFPELSGFMADVKQQIVRIEGAIGRVEQRVRRVEKTLVDLPAILGDEIQNSFRKTSKPEEVSIRFGRTSFEIDFPDSKTLPRLNDLELPWNSLEDAGEPDDINLLDALRWNFGLVNTLYGRCDAVDSIISWVNRASNIPMARLVTGQGGSGKTRLVATAAKVLRDQGWVAGFLKPGTDMRIELDKSRGLLLILDYPEENLDLTRQLIRHLAEMASAPYPVRLLLLSRRDFDHWATETEALGGRFGRQPLAAPSELALDDTLKLICEAARNFSLYAQLPMPSLDRAAAWANERPMHRLPLLAAAAAVHAVLSPNEAFGFEGSAIIRDLAVRERTRVRRVSERLGIGSSTLGRLLALGVLADGLHQLPIERLIESGIDEGVSQARVVPKVANTPWWKEGRLIRLQPDRLAAAFLGAELFDARFPDGDNRLPDWISIALEGAEHEFGARLGRILYDLDALSVMRGGAGPLETQLSKMIEQAPQRAVRFVGLVADAVPYAAVGFAATVALTMSSLLKDVPVHRAMFLSNASGFLSTLGQLEKALDAAREAAGLDRDLALARPEAFTSNLAGSLNNLANILSKLGQREEALDAAKEAAGLYRNLALGRPEAFTPNLAMSLNNLAAMLSELGQREGALDAAREAAGLYRNLALAQPEAFTPDLAMSLNTLAAMLSELGQREGALDAAKEAAGFYRDLALARAEAFTPDLAGSLNNLATLLSQLGQREEGLDAAKEAAGLYRNLALARPEAFTPDLAMSLTNLAAILSQRAQLEEALDAAKEAAGLYRNLALARPEAFTSNLAMSLTNLAARLSDLGQREEALDAAREANGLYRNLALVRPEAFAPNLARSLNVLALRLSQLGKREEALDAAKEADGLYRNLALVRPEAFTSNLAGSLTNLANRLSESGQRKEALDAAREAAGLYRNLALARPEAFTPDVAMSLNNLATTLSELGQHEEALDAATEATGLYRDLALARPEVFTSNLAGSLNNLANRLSEIGRHEEALDAATEATGLYRDLALARPEVFTSNLAGSLNNLANRLSEIGQRREALDAATEAAGLYRNLAFARPDAFAPDLAMSLNSFAAMLARLGRLEEALDAAKEAAGLYRDLARASPEAFTHDLAMSLDNLAIILSATGQSEGALDAAEEAAAIWSNADSKQITGWTNP